MKKSIALALVFISILMACAPKVGPKGDPGEKGKQGESGVMGPTGDNGSNGIDGSIGPTGSTGGSGSDATPVTVVKLCPETASYPSVFVEYAICLRGQLYAVYSENNGFLALIPPGAYVSHGHGSDCSFTVLSNCVVQQ